MNMYNIAANLQLFWPIIDSFQQLVSWQPYSCILGCRTQQIVQTLRWPIIRWVSYAARDRHNLLLLGPQQGFWEKYRQIESFEKLSNISSTTSMVAYGALKQPENSIHTWWREPSSWVHHPRFHDLKLKIRIRQASRIQSCALKMWVVRIHFLLGHFKPRLLKPQTFQLQTFQPWTFQNQRVLKGLKRSWLMVEKSFQYAQIKSKITIWQPPDTQEGIEWHNSMMDQLKSGNMRKFLSCNEEKSIQKFEEFRQEINVRCCCHPHCTEKKVLVEIVFIIYLRSQYYIIRHNFFWLVSIV